MPMKQLAARYPRIVATFQQFKTGSVQLYRDAKVRYTLKPEAGQFYTTHQLLTHKEFGRDVRKCLPIFILFWIPIIGQWISLPLAIMFPRQLLSRQFWTDSQRKASLDHLLKKRHRVYPELMVAMQESYDSIEDKGLSRVCLDAITQLMTSNNGIEDTTLCEIRRAYGDKKLYLPTLPKEHKMLLAQSLNVHHLELKAHAIYLNNLDRSLTHFGIHDETSADLDLLCHQRGKLLTNSSGDQLREYLKQWLSNTSNLRDQELAYLLHLAILMQRTS